MELFYIPPKFNAVLTAFKNLNMVPNIFSYFVNKTDTSTTNTVEYNFGYQSTNILLNAGGFFTALLIVISNMLIVMIFHKYRNFKLFSTRLIKNAIDILMNSFKYNAFIRFYIQSYIEFGVCAMVGITNGMPDT